MAGLTLQERQVLDLTAELWNAFAALPDKHPSDAAEMQRDIHDIQNRIMARAARRNEPEFFT